MPRKPTVTGAARVKLGQGGRATSARTSKRTGGSGSNLFWFSYFLASVTRQDKKASYSSPNIFALENFANFVFVEL